mmetsp:Transcript_71448/g.180635  ORF Transcript_71448/g.180635 Transcript_71448/m.180635 type:complete len:515 (-) Transcript_71448:350-1894(-)
MEMQLEMDVGNTAAELEGQSWAWVVFLRVGQSAGLIDHVTFLLHETFRNRVVVVERPDETGTFLSPQYSGWGVFKLGIDVHWKSDLVASPTSTRLAHMLSFSRPEATETVSASIVTRSSPDAVMIADFDVLEKQADPPQDLWSRPEVVQRLRSTPFLVRDDRRFFHGRLCGPDLPLPDAVWKSDRKPREGSVDWLTATEFADSPQVLQMKVDILAALLKSSEKTVAYTGAGISVPAGIGQAAVGSAVGKKTIDAQPTVTHHTMAALNARGWMHGWVQQNHDGLPQKAGYPQESINEIHGSWFDPSNPVVLYSGTLRSELCEDMVDLADTSDLTLVMGTSLTGLNADQVAKKPAKRSLSGASLGTVIISPQQTDQDGKATLRIFAQADAVMALLTKRLGLQVRSQPRAFTKSLKVAVPYDRHGVRSQKRRTYWNLEPGQKVRVNQHNNIEGAGQPSFKHVNAATIGEVLRRDDYCSSLVICFDGTSVRLGLWWLEAAQRGAIDRLPVVNDSPEFC